MDKGTHNGAVFVPDKARSLTARNDGSPCIDRGPEVIAVYDCHRAGNPRPQSETVCTLTARMGTGGLNVPIACYENESFSGYAESGTGATLKESGGDIGGGSENLIAGTLCATDYKGIGNEYVEQGKCVVQKKTVRRLTPLEAERLQGLPDYFTLIDDRTCSDTARYKALGNGMAQPCPDFVIRRIKEAIA